MKQYPSIQREIVSGSIIYAFDKLDGSNIRAEWSKKRGFYKFGSRKRLLGEDDPLLGEAISLINNKYGETLPKIFKKQRWNKVMCFFEFFGLNSFAGIHEDEDHDIILIDIAYDNHGILEPKEFIKIFKQVDTPSMLYHGKMNQEIIKQVRERDLPGMTFEGVVCKGKYISPGRPLMFKVKSQEWLDKVKAKYKDNQKMLEDLL